MTTITLPSSIVIRLCQEQLERLNPGVARSRELFVSAGRRMVMDLGAAMYKLLGQPTERATQVKRILEAAEFASKCGVDAHVNLSIDDFILLKDTTDWVEYLNMIHDSFTNGADKTVPRGT